MSEPEEEAINDNVTHVDFSRGRTRTKSELPVAKTPAPVTGVGGGTKLLVFRALVAESMVMVRVVTTVPGIVLPEALKSKPVQALNFSHKFGVADFVYDDRGVRASLSFGGVNVFCDVPWHAVFGMVSHKTSEAIVWPESMPGMAPAAPGGAS